MILNYLLNSLANTFYVKIGVDTVTVRCVETNKEITNRPIESFTTTRLLVGNFLTAEDLIIKTIKEASEKSWKALRPNIVVHPISMIDGGLSEVELRVFRELAAGAGAQKIEVWVGKELTNNEILNKIKNT